MGGAVDTMTPDQLAEWERRARAGVLFRYAPGIDNLRAGVAQGTEQPPSKRTAGGSNPPASAKPLSRREQLIAEERARLAANRPARVREFLGGAS